MHIQIIIPMSGFGERFRRVGYIVPKPLIEIDGKPIIAYVIEMFPGETDFTFICNRNHISNPTYHMEQILHEYCPTGRVVTIEPHKLGPLHAVMQVAHLIDPSRPVVINYSDFTCYWDWKHFLRFVEQTKCDGAIPAYRGFHPHTLGTTNYAYMRESDGWVLDIQEKQPYTDNRMKEYASSGTYYFATGRLMMDAFRIAKEQKLTTGGEFYVSLAYKPLLAAKKSIAVYELQHFMQWGTPEDVAEYRMWSDTFKRLIDSGPRSSSFPRGTVIVPMAGLGQRFVQEGYRTTKPLIPISGHPMVLQATRDLPRAKQYVFVLRRDMPGFEKTSEILQSAFPSVHIKTIETVTQGQACTASIGLHAIEQTLVRNPIPEPITFGACDFGTIYNIDRFNNLIDNPNVDVIVWAVRGHTNAIRHPQMYGWIDAEGDVIRRISVKTPLSNPSQDPIVLGTFTFRRATDFHKCVQRMLERNARINGEFYIDMCINDAVALGLHCRIFEVDRYYSWGTPNDLRTFEYWQSCFDKWSSHPYRLKLDSRVHFDAVKKLEMRYQAIIPELPGKH